MAKMINVDELIEFCNTERSMLHAHNNSVACAALRRLSEYAKDNAVEAETVKHGRWIRHGKPEDYFWNCSECKNWIIFAEHDLYKHHFCGNCGARMSEV